MSGVKVTVIKKRYNTGGTPATTHESQRPLKLQFGLTRAAPTDASARHARAQPLRMPRGTPRADHSRDALSLLLEELVRLVYILSFISSNFFCAATLAASAASAAAEAAAALALPNKPPSAPSSSCSSLHWSSSSRS